MISIRKIFPATAVLLATALTVGACSVNPATGQRQLALVSESQEIAMGREANQQVAASLGLYPDEGLQAYVQQLGKSLAAKSERPELPWEFGVVDDPTVNAFALPGGFIYVTRGILAHFNSEAELSSVLGHEIGHVTARHSVEQMSKAQLATLGLGVAMIASEDFRQFGNLAQAGMGLLFLKFGRDDERQADDLGLRYLTSGGYDPTEMAKVFVTLDRVSQAQGAGRIPDWLSTHPNPGNRSQRILAQVKDLPPEERGGAVKRDEYLRRLDGMVFGENPREGFFKENVFYHPDLKFQLIFPAGWKTLNQRQAVGAISPDEDAVVVLMLAGEDSPDAAARAFFNQQGVERGSAWREGFYHFRTTPQQGQDNIRGVVGFFRHDGNVYQLRGMTRGSRWDRYDNTVAGSLASFERLTDRRYLNVQPKKVDLVKLPRAMTLAEFAEKYPSTVDLKTLAITNGVEPNERLAAGRLVKRVVGGELPS